MKFYSESGQNKCTEQIDFFSKFQILDTFDQYIVLAQFTGANKVEGESIRSKWSGNSISRAIG